MRTMEWFGKRSKKRPTTFPLSVQYVGRSAMEDIGMNKDWMVHRHQPKVLFMNLLTGGCGEVTSDGEVIPVLVNYIIFKVI